MTENEEIKVEMDEGVVEVGGEEELKVNEAKKKQEELIVKQAAEEKRRKKMKRMKPLLKMNQMKHLQEKLTMEN